MSVVELEDLRQNLLAVLKEKMSDKIFDHTPHGVLADYLEVPLAEVSTLMSGNMLKLQLSTIVAVAHFCGKQIRTTLIEEKEVA